MLAGTQPLQFVYIVVFGLTALACFGTIGRARSRLNDEDTQWGLTTLLALSGLWATFHTVRLIAPSNGLKVTFYILDLVVGLASVGSWLYFCSAYANKTYHRTSVFRFAAIVVFAAIVAVKITNPIHHLYFATMWTATPFPHLVIELRVIHWVVTGLAYALSAVGFYILYDLFRESNHATTRLGIVVGLAGLPVILDLIGYLSPESIITLNYEPIGVAIFAIGALYITDGTFLAVRTFGREQLIDELDEGIILLDSDHIIQDVNDAAIAMFPNLQNSIGQSLNAVAPELADHLPIDGNTILTHESGEMDHYCLLTASPLTVGPMRLGQTLLFTDITELERQRRHLEVQQTRMDDFASAITHELRNTLNVIQGRLDLLSHQINTDGNQTVEAGLREASRMSDRMAEVVTDLSTLVQLGRPVEETTAVDVGLVAERAFDAVSRDSATLELHQCAEIEADEFRLERLFENLFKHGVRNGASTVKLSQEDDQLVYGDDGVVIDQGVAAAAFSFGEAVPNAESGMLLPIVRVLAEAHGWTVAAEPGTATGSRITIRF